VSLGKQRQRGQRSDMAPKAPTKPSDAELTTDFNHQWQDVQALLSKIGEMNNEADEHVLVIQTLSEASAKDSECPCCRMIGSVLVKKTVKEVLPTLEMHLDGIRNMIAQLEETYKKKEEAFRFFKEKHNIHVSTAQ